MRILLTTDTVGGVWTYCMELARSLAGVGVEVSLATMGAPLSTDQRREADAVSLFSLHESLYKLEWMDHPWEDVDRAGRWLLGLEKDLRPDIIHLNGYCHGALPWMAPVLVVGHSCVLSWWQAVKREAAPVAWDQYQQEVTLGLRAADVVVAPTAAMLGDLNRYYGPLPHSQVIPNGRDRALFLPGDKEPLVLAAGRLWDDAKNIAALDAIAPVLPWPIYVAGRQQRPEGGETHRSHLHLLGQLPAAELAGWLGRASIYALPARYEPFGLSALEAGHAGCALVLGDIPSLREVWSDAALYVPPDDQDALRVTLRSLMNDPALLFRMAAAARQRAARYTQQRMAEGYYQVYLGLMK